MNWTGGNLQRFSRGRGKKSDASRKQKEFFARQRLKLNNGSSSQSPLKFSFVEHGQAGRDEGGWLLPRARPQAFSTKEPDQNISKGTNHRGDHFRADAPNSPIDTHRLESSARHQQLPRRAESDLDRDERHQSCHEHPRTLTTEPQRTRNHSNAAQTPALPKSPSSLEMRLSVLQKQNWVGLPKTKPVKLKFTSATERDRIGKRRKVNQEDLARRCAPARVVYPHGFEDGLVYTQRLEEEGNSLLKELTIKIGRPGKENQEKESSPSQHPHEQVLSSDSMLLDKERMVMDTARLAGVARDENQSQHLPSDNEFPSSISAFLRQENSSHDHPISHALTPPLRPVAAQYSHQAGEPSQIRQRHPLCSLQQQPASRRENNSMNEQIRSDTFGNRSVEILPATTCPRSPNEYANHFHRRVRKRRPQSCYYDNPNHRGQTSSCLGPDVSNITDDTWHGFSSSFQGSTSLTGYHFGSSSQSPEHHRYHSNEYAHPDSVHVGTHLTEGDHDEEEEAKELAHLRARLAAVAQTRPVQVLTLPNLENADYKFCPNGSDAPDQNEPHSSFDDLFAHVRFEERDQDKSTANASPPVLEDEPWMRLILGDDYDKGFSDGERRNGDVGSVQLTIPDPYPTMSRTAIDDALESPFNGQGVRRRLVSQARTNTKRLSRQAEHIPYSASPRHSARSSLPRSSMEMLLSTHTDQGTVGEPGYSSQSKYSVPRPDGQQPSEAPKDVSSQSLPRLSVMRHPITTQEIPTTSNMLLPSSPARVHRTGFLPNGQANCSQRVIFSKPPPFVGSRKPTAREAELVRVGRNVVGLRTGRGRKGRNETDLKGTQKLTNAMADDVNDMESIEDFDE